MIKTIIIGKFLEEKPKYALFEYNADGFLEENFDKIIYGEEKMEKICQALIKKLAPPKRKQRLPGFMVKNLDTVTMTVGSDGHLSLIFPLTEDEMKDFHSKYRKAGQYE